MILTAAVVTTGLVAGLFQAFGYAVMPGLRRTDDATFVRTMRAVNGAIIGPWFLLLFGGALLLSVAAAVAAFIGDDGRLPWVTLGLLGYLLTVGITGRVNVPLNTRLEVAPVATAEQARAARQEFEARWVRWNLVRGATSTAAFLALLAAVGQS